MQNVGVNTVSHLPQFNDIFCYDPDSIYEFHFNEVRHDTVYKLFMDLGHFSRYQKFYGCVRIWQLLRLAAPAITAVITWYCTRSLLFLLGFLYVLIFQNLCIDYLLYVLYI